RANQMKNEFLAMMSHEIRTPLNNVMGISEILVEDGLDAEKREEYIDIIRSSGGLLLSVINDVLDYSKIEAEELKIQPAKISLRTLVHEVVRLLKLKAKEHCVALSVNVHDDAIDEIVLDPVRLKQVLINLVDNAIKYSQGGEVVIDVETKAVSEDKQQLSIAVRDNGIGIPEEHLSTIFNRFDKGMYRERSMLKGTGLGLYIVRKLLELMGGSISVQSVLGKGTEFQCSIPISSSDEQQNPIKDMIDSRHFLVVDDEAINHDIMQRYFSVYERQPYLSLSGRAAMTLLNDMYQEHGKNIIDVMLIDCMMPGMDGVELIEEIKKDPRFKDIFLILMSSSDTISKYKHSGEDAKSDEVHYDACMVKPLYEDQFFEKLGIILMNYMLNNQKKLQH
ncbi:MAG: ATP-binding protein, partial [Rickettsiales bacterium]|nr:ATP-binding protein [Rickettsiales bacterium]